MRYWFHVILDGLLFAIIIIAIIYVAALCQPIAGG